MNVSFVGQGKVHLLAGGGVIHSEQVAKFCRSEKEVEEIIAEPYLKSLLTDLIESRHKAALEFDDYIFGISGYARVTEVQLVRKRLASYMIKSGRAELKGKRAYNVVIPESIKNLTVDIRLDPDTVVIEDTDITLRTIIDKYIETYGTDEFDNTYKLWTTFDTIDLLGILETWYENGLVCEVPEEELRYMKPQATEFRAAIKMNAAGLYDWFQIRLCNRAQTEIRDLATKMYQAAYAVHPDIFEHMGPACKVLGYCPESRQCKEMKGKIPTKKEALEILKKAYYNEIEGLD